MPGGDFSCAEGASASASSLPPRSVNSVFHRFQPTHHLPRKPRRIHAGGHHPR